MITFILYQSAGSSGDATGAQKVLQSGRHQRPPEHVHVDGAAAVGADDVDAAVGGGGGHGTEENVLLAEGDGGAPRGESHLRNGEITTTLNLTLLGSCLQK